MILEMKRIHYCPINQISSIFMLTEKWPTLLPLRNVQYVKLYVDSTKNLLQIPKIH